MAAAGEEKKEEEKKARKQKEKRYTRRLEILITDHQYEHLSLLNGGLGFHVRSMIDAHMGHYDKEEDELKNRLSVLEPEYLGIKKRLQEIDEIKKQNLQAVMAKEKSIEFAHMKLLEALKNSYNQMEYMSSSIWKFYSDQCGESVDDLKKWVREEMARKGIKV